MPYSRFIIYTVDLLGPKQQLINIHAFIRPINIQRSGSIQQLQTFRLGQSKTSFVWFPSSHFCCSDYRSSNIGPSDSEKDCPSRRDSEVTHLPVVQPPRLGITAPSNDSESGGSHSPSPRASRRRQVKLLTPLLLHYAKNCLCSEYAITRWRHCACCRTTPSSPSSGSACSFWRS